MKAIFALALPFVATSAFANACPSIDQAIADYKAGNGRATLVDVNDAIICQKPSCELVVKALESNVVMAVLLVGAGEATSSTVIEAANALAAEKNECLKKSKY